MPYKDPVKAKANRATHRHERNARNAAYAASHREEKKARDAAYYDTHQEEVQARNAAYDAANPDKRKARRAAHHATHREEDNARNAAYHAANPEVFRTAKARRRARTKGLPATLTAAQWRSIKAVYKGRCAYCGTKQKRLTQDHVIPLSKGGSTTLNNIVPACRSCNSKKGTNLPANPVRLVLL